MAGPGAPYTTLDANQVLQQSFDQTNDRLRVDASVTATIGDVTINATESDIAIADRVSGYLLKVNADGSIDTNVIINASSGDNIFSVGSEDGTITGVSHVIRVDSDLDLRVSISNGANKAGVNASGEVSVVDSGSQTALNSILTTLLGTVEVNDVNSQAILTSIEAGTPDSLGQKTMANSQPVVIASDQSSIPVSIASFPLPAGAATEAKQDSQITILNSIDSGIPNSLGQQLMSASMPVVISSDQTPIPVAATLTGEPILISGTEDGTPTGIERTFLNNLKLLILDTQDRISNYTYADFGTKNQRITEITYTSTIFPSTTIKRTFAYTLVGTNYRRDSETWSVI